MSTRTRSSVIATVALASAATLGLASAATAAEVTTYPFELLPGFTIEAPYPNYEITIDCDEWVEDDSDAGYGDFELAWVPGGTLDINLTCEPEDLYVEPVDDELDGGDFPAGYETTAGTGDIELVYSFDPNTAIQFDLGEHTIFIYYFASVELDDPAGDLLLTQEATTPENGTQTLDFAEGITDEPFVECDLDEERVYAAIEFTVLEGGAYTFRVVDVSPLQSGELRLGSEFADWWTYEPNPWGDYVPIADPFFVLYSSFDPDQPAQGLVECNDDIDVDLSNNVFMRDSANHFISGVYPELIVDLEPGEYTLVVTTYDTVGSPDPSAAPAKVDAADAPLAPAEYELDGLPEQSATVQFWGVEGGLELGHAAELAETGPDSARSTGLAIAALLALLVGAAAVTIARRRTA